MSYPKTAHRVRHASIHRVTHAVARSSGIPKPKITAVNLIGKHLVGSKKVHQSIARKPKVHHAQSIAKHHRPPKIHFHKPTLPDLPKKG